jgi:hypothetical protein
VRAHQLSSVVPLPVSLRELDEVVGRLVGNPARLVPGVRHL